MKVTDADRALLKQVQDERHAIYDQVADALRPFNSIKRISTTVTDAEGNVLEHREH